MSYTILNNDRYYFDISVLYLSTMDSLYISRSISILYNYSLCYYLNKFIVYSEYFMALATRFSCHINSYN